jgi:hypothetical protein
MACSQLALTGVARVEFNRGTVRDRRTGVRRVAGAILGSVGTVSIALVCASVVGAATPGTWSELEGPALSSPISQFGAVAGADGSLFVAFADAGPAGKILVSHASADGTYLSTFDVFQKPTSGASTPAGSPAIVREASGRLLIVYSGERSFDSEVFAGEGTTDGSTWTPAAAATSFFDGAQIASAVASDGTVYFAQAATSVYLHRGTTVATPPQTFPSTGDPEEAGIAADGSDASVWLGWTSGPGGLALRVRHADPATGAPTGPEYVAPDLAGAPVSTIYYPTLLQPLAISGVTGRSGAYVAYVSQADRANLLLWHVGDALPRAVATSNGTIENSTLAAAADGGLWIIWLDSALGVRTVQYRELASDGTTLGPVGTLALPPTPAFLGVTQLLGVAQPGGVEIVLGSDAMKIYATLAPALTPASTTPPPTTTTTPPPTIPPVVTPPTLVKTASVATSLSPKVKVGVEAVLVTLYAPKGATASGTIQLKARVASGKKAKRIGVGSASFRLAIGQARTLTVKLDKAGRAALLRAHRLAISVLIGARNAAGKAKTTTRSITLRVAVG